MLFNKLQVREVERLDVESREFVDRCGQGPALVDPKTTHHRASPTPTRRTMDQKWELARVGDQLQHSLMTGTLARRDDATDEEVAIALLHDVGKSVNIPNHGPIAAELLRPYVSGDAYHVIYNHQHFQGKFHRPSTVYPS